MSDAIKYIEPFLSAAAQDDLVWLKATSPYACCIPGHTLAWNAEANLLTIDGRIIPSRSRSMQAALMDLTEYALTDNGEWRIER